MKSPRPLVVSVSIALLLTACSSGAKTAVNSGAGNSSTTSGQAASALTSPPSTAFGPLPLVVVEHDFALATNETAVAGRSVVFNVTNHGPSSHELLAFQTNLPEDQLPLGPDGRINEDALPKVLDTATDLPAGSQRRLTETLAPGRYVLVCNLPGHYKLGMHTVINVT
jgi:uncharacterized cupredoxin-like copper-binding protein